jgi:DUF1009 family protein
MFSRARKLAVTTVVSGAMVLGLAPVASAQIVNQDGLVNVNVGDVTILEDVNVAVGANVAATICDLDVGPLALAVLGEAIAVDRSGRERTICESDAGPVTISQN